MSALPRAAAAALFLGCSALAAENDFEPLRFNNPGLTVDLAVGLWAWPIPMDFNGDGKMDLVVVCPDTPSNGTWYFENIGPDPEHPLFKPGVRISEGQQNISPSYDLDGKVRVLGPAKEFPDFAKSGLAHPVKIAAPGNVHPNKVRANQWKYVDFDGDGKLDLVVGVGDWTEYGWDNAFDAAGHWTHGPLHGAVYWLHNTGDDEHPVYAPAQRIEPIDTFGMPSPNFVDFDGDGDLDLICGEFLDGFTYYENIGTRTEPKYAPGRRLLDEEGNPVHMDLEMCVPVAFDWNKDGFVDLVVGDEDGRVALIENTGNFHNRMPIFRQPRYFQQQADLVKFGALVSPVSVDWDGDGLDDLVCGCSAGYIGFIKNLGGSPPRWAAPVRLEVEGKPLRIMAGPNGSVQGPAEAKWGYTTLSVADWDGDGLPDLIVNSIWGKVLWYKNIGTRTEPKLAAPQPIEVEWAGPAPKPAWTWWQPFGRELVTQWRTTPAVRDFTGAGANDLAMLDPEGYLALFRRVRREGAWKLQPGERVFLGPDGPLRLNKDPAGKSGRRKLCFTDWDGDGTLDLLVNSKNVDFLHGEKAPSGQFAFRLAGLLGQRVLAGHDTSPTTVDWGKTGVPDLVVGAEDGHLYYLKNPRQPVR
jgi:hypothetical protein